MDLRHKVGQTAIVRVRDDNPEMGDDFEKYFCEYGYGGIFMGAEIIRPGHSGRADLARVSADLRKRSEIPPVFCGDAEAGFRNILCDEDHFPDQMALGAADDSDLCYRFGKATAKECLAGGINWSFSPVADLNLNPLNPIVNNRSLGDDPDKVLPLLSAIIAGMQDNGLAATVKHFPGDGVDFRDQHFVKTANSLSEQEWMRCYGNLYRALFAQGAMSVMVGHMTLPWYQGGNAFDRLPATLSGRLLNDLLKGELGFSGVVVSDALEMGAFEQEFCDRERAEIEAFKAGVDMMLWPSKGYFRNLEAAVRSGEVPEERLDDALGRIWEFKNRLGCFKKDYARLPELDAREKAACDALSREISARSVTLVRDEKKFFPLQKSEIRKVALVLESVNEKGYKSLARLSEILVSRGFETDLYQNGVDEGWQPRLNAETIAQYDLVLVAMYLRPHEPLGFLDFPDLELVGISRVINLPARRIVSVSFGSPYVHRMYCERVPACVNCYSDTKDCMEAFVDAIFGESAFVEKSPVRGVREPEHV